MSRLETLTRAVNKDIADGMHSLNLLFVIQSTKKKDLMHLFLGNKMKSSKILKGIQLI